MRDKRIHIILKRFIALAVLIVSAMSLMVLYNFDPSAYNFYPKCPLFVLTGFKCPGCGVSRAFYQILHGNIWEALRYNPILAVIIPIGIFYTLSSSHSKKIALSVVFLIVTVIWWVLRNLIHL
ncbi:MAG: DUF2752 domain-containing protein [Kiritimatiellae bacterium]|nr:DUF2752 domain-containing protein [Kiritimatiellia bacterium]